MSPNLPSVGIRLSDSLKAKLLYIAEHNNRSIDKEIAAVLTWYVNKFEQKRGKIKVNLAKDLENYQNTTDNGGMSMYMSNRICPDCGEKLMLAWRWPEIIMNRPVRLVFICKQCNGEVKEIPESSTVIYANGRNVLDRHIDVYNQAVPFMAENYLRINTRDIHQSSDPAIIAYRQGLTAACAIG
ncbi:hypothetical protein [Sporomusa sphaeroides]|uniref:Uncharacterized protein n=1 Tax=Sporomusa sphaeroides DSM 2875 TaxID=1337886 RepID=A0ABP2C0E0_9FIRM|nr:hypothetical protein [Sporomusa sphaeroides]OLS58280.1 hypothetical protein SPSPH_18160 [Sporomusa sphaeroides DSM 2875]CVK17533.1 hypothetical protein SSPH_00167 [Sporomusa sphaeroides DSM 2875]